MTTVVELPIIVLSIVRSGMDTAATLNYQLVPVKKYKISYFVYTLFIVLKPYQAAGESFLIGFASRLACCILIRCPALSSLRHVSASHT